MTRIEEERIDEMRKVADALDEFAMIDEAEGGNPLVIATERRAAELLRAQGGGRVKGMTWWPVAEMGPDAEEASGILTGTYRVFQDEDSAFGAVFAEWAHLPDQFCTTVAKTLGRFVSFEEAKAAAEADYRTRILSALETEAVEPVAWRCEDLILPSISIIDDKAHAEARMRRPDDWRVTPLYAHPEVSPVPTVTGEMKFKLGDWVQKTKGSSWRGHVVGFYSTTLTPIGYCVESNWEPGSVQIYPESALSSESKP